LSQFHHQYGYYADGVDETTAKLPAGWRNRLIRISGPLTQNIHGFASSGLCLERHDLVISKLAAARPKDLDFFHALVRMGELDETTLRLRLAATDLAPAMRSLIEAQVEAAFPR
jgi:hypothetical protein